MMQKITINKGGEMLIGRDASRCRIVIPPTARNASNLHAKVSFDGQKLTIEDQGSRNGTFVDGLRVFKKDITPASVVTLGGPDSVRGYRLDLYSILNLGGGMNARPASPRMAPPGPQPQAPRAPQPQADPNEIDPYFSARVRDLGQIYEEYQEELAELQKQSAGSMKIRMLPSMIIGSVGSLVSIAYPSQEVHVYGIIGTLIVTIGVFCYTNTLISERMADSVRKRRELTEEFELNFVCPECKGSWRSHSFAYISRLGQCPCCKKKFRL